MSRRLKSKSEAPQTTAQSLGSLLKSARDIMRKDKGLNGDLDRLPLLTWIMFLKFLDDLELQRADEAALAGKKFRPAIEPPYRWRDWAANPQGITGDELLAFINQEECVRPNGTRGLGLFTYLRKLTSSNGDGRRDVIATVFRGVDNRVKSGYLMRDVVNRVANIHFTSSGELQTLGTLYESMLREMRDAAGDSGEFYTPRAVVRFMVAVTDPCLGETVLDPASGTGGFIVEAFNHLSQQVKTVADRKRLQEHSLFGCEPKPLPYLLCQMNLLLHGLDAPQIDSGNALRFKLTEIGERDRVDVILTNPPFGGEEEKGIQGNFPEDRQTSETALLFLQLIMRRLHRATTSAGRPARAALVVPESVMGDAGIAASVRRDLIEHFNLHTIVRLPKGVFEPYSDIQTNLLFFDTSGSTSGVWFCQHEVPSDRRGMRNPCYTRTMPLQFEELAPILQWWKNRSIDQMAWYVPKSEIISRNFSFDFRNPALSAREYVRPTSVAGDLRTILSASLASLSQLASRAEAFELKPKTRVDRRPLGTFLRRVRTDVDVEPETSYKQITVRLYGKGVVLRQIALGDEILTRPQYRASTGHLIMSRIDARNGAFGIVPDELDGAIVTQDFPLFEIDQSVVYPDFLALLLRSTRFLEVCQRSSRGTTNRKRLSEELFLSETVPIPPDDVQLEAIELFKLSRAADEAIQESVEVAEALIPSLSGTIFG